MSGRVVVVGSVNVDLVVRAPRLPTPGETVTGGTFEQHDGGKGGNQAVAAARLGRPTLFIGAVGDDAFGTQARAALQAEHVDTSRLVTIPGNVTGVAVIMVDERAENLIAVASGANAALEPYMVAEAIGRLGPLERDVVLVSNEVPAASVREALRVGRTNGAITVLNPAPAHGLDASTLALADVMTPNRSELSMLVNAVVGARGSAVSGEPVEAAASLVDALPEPRTPTAGVAAAAIAGPAVVVTLGSAGARIVRRGSGAEGAIAVEAPSVDAIDSTGAGDAFVGALAVALALGHTLETACARAAVAGALATTRVGAREGMPSADRFEAFLAEGFPELAAVRPPSATPAPAGEGEAGGHDDGSADGGANASAGADDRATAQAEAAGE
ncbi:MAG TPA: ribokinase [Candidatus Dormibacteraeota bacterium]|nr:ribokinase [Candidatus Dormibacteraeota bacterium]